LARTAVHPGARARAHRWPTAASAIIGAVLVAGVAVRVLLAFVNLEANDAHLPVIRAIAFEHRFPTREQEWEGFQPKLYHTTAGLVWRLLPTRDPYALTRAAQLEIPGVVGIRALAAESRDIRCAWRQRRASRAQLRIEIRADAGQSGPQSHLELRPACFTDFADPAVLQHGEHPKQDDEECHG